GAGRLPREIADGHDRLVAHADVAATSRRARAVDDGGALDLEIEHLLGEATPDRAASARRRGRETKHVLAPRGGAHERRLLTGGGGQLGGERQAGRGEAAGQRARR